MSCVSDMPPTSAVRTAPRTICHVAGVLLLEWRGWPCRMCGSGGGGIAAIGAVAAVLAPCRR